MDLGDLAEVLARWLPVTSAGDLQQTPGPCAVAQVKPDINVFNLEDLLERLMGDRELAGIILKGFVEDVPSQLNKCARV